jgi:prevent-host-death family protein
MEKVNVHDAKTHFSRLLDRAAAGEEFVIAKAGKPVAHLGPIPRARTKVRFGLLKGRIRVPDDFNAPLPEAVLDAFEGRRR